jgi:hypothetical protein
MSVFYNVLMEKSAQRQEREEQQQEKSASRRLLRAISEAASGSDNISPKSRRLLEGRGYGHFLDDKEGASAFLQKQQRHADKRLHAAEPREISDALYDRKRAFNTKLRERGSALGDRAGIYRSRTRSIGKEGGRLAPGEFRASLPSAKNNVRTNAQALDRYAEGLNLDDENLDVGPMVNKIRKRIDQMYKNDPERKAEMLEQLDYDVEGMSPDQFVRSFTGTGARDGGKGKFQDSTLRTDMEKDILGTGSEPLDLRDYYDNRNTGGDVNYSADKAFGDFLTKQQAAAKKTDTTPRMATDTRATSDDVVTTPRPQAPTIFLNRPAEGTPQDYAADLLLKSRQQKSAPRPQPSAQPRPQPSPQPSSQPSSQPQAPTIFRNRPAEGTSQDYAANLLLKSRQQKSAPRPQPSPQPSSQPSPQPSPQPSSQPSSQPSPQQASNLKRNLLLAGAGLTTAGGAGYMYHRRNKKRSEQR